MFGLWMECLRCCMRRYLKSINIEKSYGRQGDDEMEYDCPVCGESVNVPDDVIEGEIVECETCGSALEVGFDDRGNVILMVAEEIGEDWGE